MSDFDDIGFQYRFTRDRTPSPRPKAMSNNSTSSIGSAANSMNTIPYGMNTQQPSIQRRFSSGMPSTIPAGYMQYQNIFGNFPK
ncbi:hypothetical protein TTHERM_00439110 (macronuclear) [Tetrahymena thermophila SB210]|uniref:Uncharacterized protein n=1 Tax=Tetrahymena thermophila (strain SB210) TaxID=312017 RepID=I7MET5_TETTS|nr:hypothetical protein TTHERM_00439110 [Tetrahymena thermophila SB210]EAR97563.3 hypothetical protein TTHERM_00439110 [Tetrahymena thermophila SB210]|eukprot:XP_001017808.3 hypothetical protein TTHERM_00439110 [Tetrahymena thermophila SB210]